MIIAIPVAEVGQADPQVGGSWGKARALAAAEVTDGELRGWEEHTVGWDVSHDEGTHGAHHSRVMRFLRDNRIDVVAAPHVGPGMIRMLDSAGISLVTGVSGAAKEAAVAAAALVAGQGRA